MHFNYFDIIIAIPLVLAVYRGWTKGFILQLATLVALVLGLWGAQELTKVLVPYLKTHQQITSEYTHIVVFAVCLLILFFLIYGLGWLLTGFVKIVALGIPNRIAGVVFAVCKYAILLGYVILYLDKCNNKLNFMDPTLPDGSFFYIPLLKLAQWMNVHLLL